MDTISEILWIVFVVLGLFLIWSYFDIKDDYKKLKAEYSTFQDMKDINDYSLCEVYKYMNELEEWDYKDGAEVTLGMIMSGHGIDCNNLKIK